MDEFRVDIDPLAPANHHGDAFDFIMTTELRFDTIILDPPWSLRKSREKYGGRVVGSFTKIKDNLKRILNGGGRVITVGYSSTGMSKSRGFEKKALCVVCHNGDHDDAYAVEEEYDKDIEAIVEEAEHTLTDSPKLFKELEKTIRERKLREVGVNPVNPPRSRRAR